MRSLLLLALVLLLAACAREATGPDPDNTFLAPASAPPSVAVNSEGQVVETRDQIETPAITDLGDDEARLEPNGGQLTPEQVAAAKRMGPGRLGKVYPETVEAATPNAADVRTPATMPAPTQATVPGGKPALDYDRPVAMVMKGACYSAPDCRQYTLTLTNAQTLLLAAGRGTKQGSGNYQMVLSPADYNKVVTALEAIDAAKLSATYPTDAKAIPADLQVTRLKLMTDAGTDREVEVYADAPEKVQAALDILDGFVALDGWRKL